MRQVYLGLIILFAAIVAAFALQNLEGVEVALLRMRIHVPLALLIVCIYALGALTGGSLLALLRHSYERARVPR